MLFSLSTPATNDRSPRYSERALAAIHQATLSDEGIVLSYEVFDGRTVLTVATSDRDSDRVTNPIAANYPNCSLAQIEQREQTPSQWKTWWSEPRLTPEVFPILRHTQFEDLLNGTFADPVGGILRAILPHEESGSRVEIHIARASSQRRRQAIRAIRTLDREFFHVHHRLAEYYAEHITRTRKWYLAWLLGQVARASPRARHTSLDTSSSRLHDREERLQAAADKLGGHLFETHIRLIAWASPQNEQRAIDRIHQMAGALVPHPH